MATNPPFIPNFKKTVAKLAQRDRHAQHSQKKWRGIDELYLKILENTAHGIIILDSDYSISFINEGFCQLLGYTKDEVEGEPIQYLLDLEKDQLLPVKNDSTLELPSVSIRNKERFTLFAHIHASSFYEKGKFSGAILVITKIVPKKSLDKQVIKAESDRRKVLGKIQRIANQLPVGCILLDVKHTFLYWNSTAKEIFGFQMQEIKGKSPFDLIVRPSARLFFNDLLSQLNQDTTTVSGVGENITKSGATILCEWFFTALYDSKGKQTGIVAVCQDVTQRYQNERLLEIQKQILEMIISGKGREEILNALVKLIEKESGEAFCSILFLDEKAEKLENGIAPSLPDNFNNKIYGIRIGPNMGSCGTAVFRKETVIVSDISSDPLWTEYKQTALKHNIHSCTSAPILGKNKQVLGTFAFYYKRKGYPSKYDFKLIEASSALAGITIERHNYENNLKDTQELFQLITQNVNDVISLTDLDGKVTYVCPAILQVLGIKPEEYLNSNIADNVHSSDVRMLLDSIRKLKKGRALEIIYRKKLNNDSWRWIQSWNKLVERKGQDCILRVEKDITEKKISEETILRSQQRLNEAQRIANFGSWELDFENDTCIWSDQLFRMFGYKPGEIEPTFKNFIDLVHPDDRERVKQAVENIRNRESNAISMEIKVVKPNKEEIIIYSTSEAKIDEEGKTVKLVGINQDITQRKKAEEIQRKLTQELIRQNRDLQQFGYITSHNLRSPVSNILGIINVFNTSNPADRFNKTLLEKLKLATVNLDTIIKDLNTILSIREVNENRQKIEFSLLLKVVRESLENPIAKAHAKIVDDFSEEPFIYCVLSYIQSIFTNIIDNAIKFRSPERDLVIHIKSFRQDGKLCISFCDNGLGIDLSKYGEKLFGLYKRFHLHVEGKGMGLHIVKTQVEAMGGTLEVDSIVNKGSCFTIRFNN